MIYEAIKALLRANALSLTLVESCEFAVITGFTKGWETWNQEQIRSEVQELQSRLARLNEFIRGRT